MKNADSYNRIAEKWAEYRKMSKINKCIEDFAAMLPASSKILDIGCGTGRPIAEYLSEKGFIVSGIDISEEMIKRARTLHIPNADFLCADFMEINIEEIYDAVIAFDSIWHIEYEKQAQIYEKVAAVLREGGLFLFTHGITGGEITGEMFGESFCYGSLDSDELLCALAKNGFETLSFIEKYREESTGERDLLAVVQKKKGGLACPEEKRFI